MRSTVGVEPQAVAVAPGGTRRPGHRVGGQLRLEHRHAGRPRHLAGRARRSPWAPSRWRSPSRRRCRGRAPCSPSSPNFGSNTVTPINVGYDGAGRAHPGGTEPADDGGGVGCAAGRQLRQRHAHTDRRRRPCGPARRCPCRSTPTGDRGRGGPAAAAAYVCGGAGLVPVTLTALGPDVGTQIGLPDVAQGVALERRRRDGMGDPAGRRAGPGDPGHRDDGPGHPPRGAPVGHRHRRGLSRLAASHTL